MEALDHKSLCHVGDGSSLTADMKGSLRGSYRAGMRLIDKVC